MEGEAGDSQKDYGQLDNEKLLSFYSAHPNILRNDERGRKGRETLWNTFRATNNSDLSVEDIQNKLIDLLGKWRSSDVDTLISHFRENPMLWDASRSDYKDRVATNICIENLARKLNFRKTSAEILAKFDNLRTTFQAKIKKGKTGEGRKLDKRWPYFQDLTFLEQAGVNRSSLNIITIASSPSVTSSSSPSNTDSEGNEFLEYKGRPPYPTTSKNAFAGSGKKVFSETGKYVFAGTGSKRKHSPGDLQRSQPQHKRNCTDEKPDGLTSFGTSIGEALRKFTDTNQELVKAELQKLLAISLRHQSKGLDVPVFKLC